MITERLMKPGSWEINLRGDAPYDLRAALDFFGHVLVTPTHVDSRLFGDSAPRHGHLSAPMLDMARYTGILRRRGRRLIGGIGIEGWLGTPEGYGSIFESGTLTTQSYLDWLSDILTGLGFTVLADPGVPGTLEANIIGMTPRQALDHIDAYFGTEYRVFPNGDLYAGGNGTVGFVDDPTVVALRKGGGRDLTLAGLKALELDMDSDLEDYVNQVVVFARGEGASTVTANAGTTTPYKDLWGQDLAITKAIDSPTTPSGGPDSLLALNELAKATETRRAVKLSTDTYDIGRDVAAGDWIYVYDPDAYLFDTTNEVRYRGRLIYPVKLRVYATTWPVEQGMGVYYRDVDGVYTDITQWVDFEDGATTFEVGALPRDFDEVGTDPLAASALIERLNR